MTRVVLVRHGQTEWNRVERFRGHTDIPLNETGIWQAEQAGRAIKERYSVSAIYTSPMSRATRTAEIIGQATGVPVQVLPPLGDYSFGEWEGKTPEEVKAEYPEQFRLWMTAPHRAKIPGGESLRRRRLQVAAALERLAVEHQDQTVVLVSHRIVSKIITCYLLGLDNSHLWGVDLDTASISLFQRHKWGWLTLMLNDTCHLRANHDDRR